MTSDDSFLMQSSALWSAEHNESRMLCTCAISSDPGFSSGEGLDPKTTFAELNFFQKTFVAEKEICQPSQKNRIEIFRVQSAFTIVTVSGAFKASSGSGVPGESLARRW